MAKRRTRELVDAAEILRGAVAVAEGVAKRAIKKFADDSAAKFKLMIEQQQFEAFKKNPLSKGWAVYKKGHNLDPRVMISTRNYLDSIKVFKEGKGYRIGFANGAMVVDDEGNEKDLTLEALAGIHEETRPHWNPFYKIMLKDAKSVADRTSKEIVSEIPGRLQVTRKMPI